MQLIIVVFVLSDLCFSQDYTWWNDKHNWDGVSHWSDYIITTPAYMGPNALPVPEIKNGTLANSTYLKLSIEKHSSKGDKTENVDLEFYSSLYNDKVGLKISVVPIEHFKLDTLTRDLRRVRKYSGEGYTGGDIYIGTYFQIIRNKNRFPDLLLTINIKTASGRSLENARYTDSPAYYIDLSAGRDISVSSQVLNDIKLYAMLGFYCWQMQGAGQFQDDALLYGVGAEFQLSGIKIKNSLGGYVGYKNNGDRPMVYRLKLRSKFKLFSNYELSFQKGLHDFNYTTIRMSYFINLEKVKMLLEHK